MMRTKGILKYPIWVFKRIRGEYYLLLKYRKKHFTTFNTFLNELDFDFHDFLRVSDEFLENKELIDYINSQFCRYGIEKKYPPD